VVLEAGYPGGSSLEWTLAASRIAAFATVLAYDRAGIGWSREGPLPRTAHRIAMELHALLATLGATTPLVLVGHSGGGLIARTFQRLYPDWVRGLVLVDASHEEQLSRIPEARAELRRMRRSLTSRLWLSRFHIAAPILARRFGSTAKRFLQPDVFAACIAMESRPRFITTARREIDAMAESMRFLRDRSRQSQVPTVVLTRGRNLDSSWAELQAELAALSPGSGHRCLPDIGHDIHLEAPDEVARAVNDVVAASDDEQRRQRDSQPGDCSGSFSTG
jgi:pimeloyl-ACP methyl ester carboxylesterase